MSLARAGAIAGLLLLVAGLTAAVWLWTPAGQPFDGVAARAAAQAYDVRVLRDRYGVPHVYGERNADVAFGVAYAHAQDDWHHIEQVLLQNRAQLAQRQGQPAAASDYLMLALGNIDNVRENYASAVSAPARAVAEGYAAGLNLWCADHPDSDCAATLPARGEDVIAGFANRPPFFYGLDREISRVLQDDGPVDLAAAPERNAYLGVPADVTLGSNAIAVAPSRSSDGHTRFTFNSHQPYTGPVAWYEARLKSAEGIDVIGGLFPGSPVVFGGAGPRFGWAATVNHPDLSDVFLLTVDDPDRPTRYRLDGEWRDFEVFPIEFRVHLWGPFSLPVSRRGLRSVHGPAFVTPRGVFALSYAGDGELRHMDHYLAMNMATSVAEWRAAQEQINAIPSINYVAADSGGHIGFFYNAQMPVREPGWDRTKVLPGDTSRTLWQGRVPVAELPAVIDPSSGYVVSANHSPLLTSAAEDNPPAAAFPASFGLDTLVTNRSLRAQTLLGGDRAISRDEFFAYKMDARYDPRSNVMQMVRTLVEGGADGDETLQQALTVLASWDGSAQADDRAAALAILTGQTTMGGQIHGETTPAEAAAALKRISARLEGVYGRPDPPWGEVSRLRRGEQSWPLNGGPDTLRAVYASGDLEARGHLDGVAGDTYVLVADWAPDGSYVIDTIHQFGSATLDASSPHYADQAPLFAAERFRQPPMTLTRLIAEATGELRLGGAGTAPSP